MCRSVVKCCIISPWFAPFGWMTSISRQLELKLNCNELAAYVYEYALLLDGEKTRNKQDLGSEVKLKWRKKKLSVGFSSQAEPSLAIHNFKITRWRCSVPVFKLIFISIFRYFAYLCTGMRQPNGNGDTSLCFAKRQKNVSKLNLYFTLDFFFFAEKLRDKKAVHRYKQSKACVTQ